LGVVQASVVPSLANPSAEVRKALKDPIESPPLSEVVSPGEQIDIVVSDKTRPSKSDVFVPVIIEELLKMGVSFEDISIIFATGTHPLHTKKDQEEIVGPEIASKVKLFDHNCKDKSNLVYIGTTRRGTRIEINRRLFEEADRIILTGVITYHYFAGFGGGRKSILPGVASFETIQANHKLVLNPQPGTGMNPMAKTGLLYGNPIHEDMEEAALMVSPDFLVNVVLNDEREIAQVFAGDFILAHGRGCDFLDDHYRVNIDQQADVVIVGCGGYPKDINFVQSHKAMDNAAYALKDGGTMILVAEAAEVFPSSVYEEWISLGSLEAIEEGLRNNFSIPGHTIYAAMEKAKKFNIIWVSKQDPKRVEKMGITLAFSIDEALALIQSNLGNDWKAYVMPDGYVTFPNLQIDT
jgi:nickel-dependent lactate racemase